MNAIHPVGRIEPFPFVSADRIVFEALSVRGPVELRVSGVSG